MQKLLGLFLVLVFVGFLVTIALVNLWVSLVLIGLLTLVCGLLIVWVILLFGERLTRLLTRIQLHFLDVELRKEELEEMRENRRLREAQNQIITFPSGHVAAIRQGDEIAVHYVPSNRVQRVIEAPQSDQINNPG